jgi:hypothetical protein
MTNFLTDLWTRLKNAIEGDATSVEATLTATEQKYAPAFGAWAKTMEATIKGQALTILEQGIADILTVVESGGNVGLAISQLVPQVIAQVKADTSVDVTTAEQDALNAAHTAIGLAIANASPAAPAPVAA